MQGIAQAREPARARHHAIQLIAVHHQQPLTASGAMYPLAVYFELAPQHLRQHRQTRIVVARDIDESRAGPLPRQQRAHDLGVLCRPECAPRQAQSIHDVADQHDPLGLDAVQKLVQLVHSCVPEAQMGVRQEQGAGARPAAARGITVCHGRSDVLKPGRAS